MVDRRFFIKTAGAAAIASLLGQCPAWAGNERARNLNAFNARSPASVYAALKLGAPEESQAIRIDAPDVAENGANVPVEVTIDLPGAERALLIGERNVYPLLADIELSPRSEAWFETKIKLAETSQLRVIVEANGRLYTASRSVKVIVGGCLAG